jgi:hypothetical protein
MNVQSWIPFKLFFLNFLLHGDIGRISIALLIQYMQIGSTGNLSCHGQVICGVMNG